MRMCKRPILKFLRFAYKSHKPYFYIIILNSLILASEVIFNAFSLSILLKQLETKAFDQAILVGILLASVNGILYFLKNIFSLLKNVHSSIVSCKVMINVANHFQKIPYEYLEDTECLDLVQKGLFAIKTQNSLQKLLDVFSSFVRQIFTISGLFIILFNFDYLLILIILGGLVINLISFVYSSSSTIKFFSNLMPSERRFEYYISTLLDEKNAKDFRIYSLGTRIYNYFSKYTNITRKVLFKLRANLAVSAIISSISKYGTMFGIYLLVVYRAVNDGLSISSFMLYVSSSIALSGVFTSLITISFDFVCHRKYIIPFIEILNINPQKDSFDKLVLEEKIKSIEFKNVTFKYPKSENIILNNVSFKVEEGQAISIVGLNGAGKTTIVKLICRFFDPISGEILVNGNNINKYEYKTYLKKISAVFQDFKTFAWSIKDNIVLDSNKDCKDIIKKIGLDEKINTLPLKENSIISKAFDDNAVDLSGGELQKIAIARSSVKEADIVILDEPTSALDPLSEAEIYEDYYKLVSGKIGLFISHRMSSSTFCDKVLVIDKGVVSDFDTHESLMKKQDSLYYKLFNEQAKNYKTNKNLD